MILPSTHCTDAVYHKNISLFCSVIIIIIIIIIYLLNKTIEKEVQQHEQ